MKKYFLLLMLFVLLPISVYADDDIYEINDVDPNTTYNVLNAAFLMEQMYYDGEYNEDLLDSALDGLPMLLLLDDGNVYNYTPSGLRINYYGTAGYGTSVYYAYANTDNLPSNVLDNNNVIGSIYLTIRGNSIDSTYKMSYGETSLIKAKDESVSFNINDISYDYDGEVMYEWIREKDGEYIDLVDDGRYVLDDYSLTISNLNYEDEGDYYLASLLISEEGEMQYYISKPFTLNVTPKLKGDMNKNDKIDLADIIMLLRKYLNGDATEEEVHIGDMDENGSIGLGDIIALLRLYLSN